MNDRCAEISLLKGKDSDKDVDTLPLLFRTEWVSETLNLLDYHTDHKPCKRIRQTQQCCFVVSDPPNLLPVKIECQDLRPLGCSSTSVSTIDHSREKDLTSTGGIVTQKCTQKERHGCFSLETKWKEENVFVGRMT